MRRLIFWIATIVLARSVSAQLVQISDTLYYPSGGTYSGSISISWPAAFIGADGHNIGPASVPVVVNVVNGVLSVTLESTTNATPIVPGRPVFYSATFSPVLSNANPQTWVVPYSASPLNLAAIQATQPPANSIINPVQISTFGAITGQCLGFNGTVVAWQSSCGTGSGITHLNGLSAATQTLAAVPDTNVTLSITPSGSTNTFTLGWSGQLGVGRGGSGASTLSGLLKGNGTSPFTSAVAGTDYIAGVANLSTVGAIPFVSSAGTLNQSGSFLWNGCLQINTVGCNSAFPLTIIAPSGGGMLIASTGANAAYIKIDNAAGGNQSNLIFDDAGTDKWEIGKQTDNGLFFYQTALGRDAIEIDTLGTTRLAPVAGNVNIGGELFNSTYKVDVQSSGSSGIMRLFDQTATTGVTHVTMQAGAGQASNQFISYLNNAGANLGGVSQSGEAYVTDLSDANLIAQLQQGVGIAVSSTGRINFSSSAESFGTADTSLYRNNPGLLEVDSGTAGVYRDIIVRYPIWTATATNDSELGNSQCTFWLQSDTAPSTRCRGSDGMVRNFVIGTGGMGSGCIPAGATTAIQYNAGAGACGGISPNVTTARQFVIQNGNGFTANNPILGGLQAGDLPSMAGLTILGNGSGSPAVPTALTAAQANVTLGTPFISATNYSSLAAAIAALSGGGGEVDLACNTTYSIPSAITLSVDIVLRGCGQASIIQLANGASSSITAMFGATTSGTTILFENLTIDGNRNNNPVALSAGVFVSGNVLFLAHDCWFQNFNASDTIGLSNVTQPANIAGNYFLRNNTHDIVLQQSAFQQTSPNVTSNTFEYNVYSITGCTNAINSVCTLSAPAQLLSAQSGTIRGASQAGLNGQWVITPIGGGPTYTQFSITNSMAPGGASTGGTFTEGGWSVALINQGWAVVANNTISGGGEQIAVNGCQFCSVLGNTMDFSSDSCITLTGLSTYNSIKGNTCGNPWLEGIFSSGFGGSSANDIEGNIISGVANSITGRGSGINMGTGTSGNVIRGGRITNNPEYGINVNSGAAGTRIEEVAMDANTLGPFTHTGDTGTLVIDHTGLFNYALITSSTSTYANGSQVYVLDANSTCSAGSSTGQICEHINGGWTH